MALSRLAQEDPSFRVRTDEESGQTIISGMGELHLEIIVDRMKREFSVEANVGKPQVAYRETIRKAAMDVEGKLVKQTGGRGQYGHVVIERRADANAARASSSSTPSRAASIPARVHPGGGEGRQREPDARRPGRLSGGGRQGDAARRLVPRGRFERAWPSRSAASMRLQGRHAPKAAPVLLEPIMKVEVVTPEDYMGDVMGDLNRRRGVLQGSRRFAVRQGDQLPRCRWPRCSAMRPPCVR